MITVSLKWILIQQHGDPKRSYFGQIPIQRRSNTMNNNRCIQQLRWKQTTSTKSTNTTQHKTLHHQKNNPITEGLPYVPLKHHKRKQLDYHLYIVVYVAKKRCLNPPTPKNGKKYLATPRININQTTIQHLHFNPNPSQLPSPTSP